MGGRDPDEGAVRVQVLGSTRLGREDLAGHRRSPPRAARARFPWNGPTGFASHRSRMARYAPSSSNRSTKSRSADRMGYFSDGLLGRKSRNFEDGQLVAPFQDYPLWGGRRRGSPSERRPAGPEAEVWLQRSPEVTHPCSPEGTQRRSWNQRLLQQAGGGCSV
jgi:hypothetical protein